MRVQLLTLLLDGPYGLRGREKHVETKKTQQYSNSTNFCAYSHAAHSRCWRAACSHLTLNRAGRPCREILCLLYAHPGE